MSPNSPIPGTTRKSLFKPISISEVTIFILGKRLQTTCTPWGAWKKNLSSIKIHLKWSEDLWLGNLRCKGNRIHWRISSLTDMRLRKMMLDSGTPLLISKEIAWTAEFPRYTMKKDHKTIFKILLVYPTSFQPKTFQQLYKDAVPFHSFR